MTDHMQTDAIQRALAALTVPVPGAVARYMVEAGYDSTDEPAVWVYVIVNDDHLERLRPAWRRLRWDIYEAIAGLVGSAVNTYVRMRAASEIAENEAHAS